MAPKRATPKATSGANAEMPMGGVHLRMGSDGVNVTSAPGYPVDMQAASPLIFAVMNMLARKDREEREAAADPGPTAKDGDNKAVQDKPSDDVVASTGGASSSTRRESTPVHADPATDRRKPKAANKSKAKGKKHGKK